jgi:hypothetical protein
MVIRELLARLGLSVDSASFKAAGSAMSGVMEGFAKLKVYGEMANGALKAMVVNLAGNAKELDQFSRRTGISTDTIQEMGHAAAVAGVSSDAFLAGLSTLATGVTQAALGGGSAAEAFYRLGINFRDAGGKAKPLEALIGEVADKVSTLPDSLQKSRVMVQLFGESGAKMLGLFNQGAPGIARAAAEAHKLGVVLDTKLIKAGVAMDDEIKKMLASIVGVKNSIAASLLPEVMRGVRAFRDWMAVHRQWIALRLHQAFNIVAQVLHGLGKSLEWIVGLLQRFWNMGAAAKAILLGLGAAVLYATAPWTALAAVISLVAEDVYLFFASGGKSKTLTGELVKLFNLLKEKAAALWDGFKKDPFGMLYKWASDFFAWVVKEAAGLGDRIATAVKGTAPTGGGDSTKAGVGTFLGHGLAQMLETIHMLPKGTASAFLDERMDKLEGWGSGKEGDIRALRSTDAGPAPITISIGALTLSGADGNGDPVAFAKQLAASVGPMIEEKLNTLLRESHAAANQ